MEKDSNQPTTTTEVVVETIKKQKLDPTEQDCNTSKITSTKTHDSIGNDDSNGCKKGNTSIESTTTTSTATPPVTKSKRNKDVFHFKHYILHHDKCAQKVGSDALIIVGYTSIGVWSPTPSQKNLDLNEMVWSEKVYDYNLGLSNELLNVDKEDSTWPRNILDIGTGSGVLSIMLSQRFKKAIVNSIDIDESAIQQITFNVDNLYKQNDHLKNVYAFHTPIQKFVPGETPVVKMEKNGQQESAELLDKAIPKDKKYDLIISAPPYFPTDAKIDRFVKKMPTNRRIARHTHTLTMDELVQNVKNLLNPETGRFTTVVSVPQPSDDLEKAAVKYGFQLLERVDVNDCPGQVVKRKMYTFKLKDLSTPLENNNIKTETKDLNNNSNNNNNNNNKDNKDDNQDSNNSKQDKDTDKQDDSNGLVDENTIIRLFPIYETTQQESTLIKHRKHSNQYKHMLSDFCTHFLKEKDLERSHQPEVKQ